MKFVTCNNDNVRGLTYYMNDMELVICFVKEY